MPWLTPWSGPYRIGVKNVFHYLDDFIVVGPPSSTVCAEAMAALNRTSSQFCVLIADHKRDGPTNRLTYLGIEIDTALGQLRWPREKLHQKVCVDDRNSNLSLEP